MVLTVGVLLGRNFQNGRKGLSIGINSVSDHISDLEEVVSVHVQRFKERESEVKG